MSSKLQLSCGPVVIEYIYSLFNWGPQTGKTTFINRLSNGDFEHNYKPTSSINMKKFLYKTNAGVFGLNFWTFLEIINYLILKMIT